MLNGSPWTTRPLPRREHPGAARLPLLGLLPGWLLSCWLTIALLSSSLSPAAVTPRRLASPARAASSQATTQQKPEGLGSSGLMALRRAEAVPLEARLELAAGDVLVDSGSGAQRVFTGAALVRGARIEAGDGARALLRLADGAAVFLRGGTTLVLEGSSLQLEKGEVWLDAPPAARKPGIHKVGSVEVSASDAGLSLKRQGNEVTIYVARGLAAVTSRGGRVEVQAGEQALVQGDGSPAVKPVSWWNDWTGGMADHPASSALAGAGAGTLYGVDLAAPPGTSARPLEIQRQSVKAVVRSGFAQTEVDQTFFNSGDRPVEGWYWFSVPQGASVIGFALETDGVLVEGELIERREAQAQYGRAVATGHEPALLEWIDAHTYRARIFPVPQGGTRRVVVRYLELLPMLGGKLRYVYPMQSRNPSRIGEFSLSVDLGAAGRTMQITTLADARIEDRGRRVTVRRSGFIPRADFQLEALPKDKPQPLTYARYQAETDTADTLMLRYMPDLDWSAYPAQPGEVVVVVDTSAAGDDAGRQLKAAAAESIVRALSASDRFAIVSLDVRPTVLYPKEGLAPATEDELARALEALAEHTDGGATDLGALFDVALTRLHGGIQPAIVYVGDGHATSGETSAEKLIERTRRALSTSRARLFAMGIGADADLNLLDAMARAGGGQTLSVEVPEQVTERALRLVAALKAPTLTDLDLEVGAGLDEVFMTANGKLTRGDELIVLARTHHELPSSLKVRGRIAGKPFERTYKVQKDRTGVGALVPGLWASEFIRRELGAADDPEQVRGKITSMGISYGLMTPYTSFLALESEAAYQQQGIVRRGSSLGRISRLSDSAEPTRSEQGRGQVMNMQPGAAGGGPRPLQRSDLGWEDERGSAGSATQLTLGAAPPRARAGSGGGVVEVSERAEPLAPARDEMAMEESMVAMPAARAKTAAPAMPSAPSMPVAQGAPLAAVSTRTPAALNKAQPRPQPATPGGLAGASAGTGSGASTGAGGTPVASVPAPPPSRPITIPARACSDLAERSLAERAVIWRQRLQTARDPVALLERLEGARAACELPDWRSEAQLLRLLERFITSDEAATVVLTHLAETPDAQHYLARLILRRAGDDRLVLAVERALFGSTLNWEQLDLSLSALVDPEARLKALREAMALSPQDPEGLIRLVALLVETGKLDEARQIIRRLAEQGLTTPRMARQLGDALARQGLEADAIRAYSEIVEFDARTPASRRLLGDIFLAHSWYGPAYSQYKALTEQNPRDSLVWLRLAAAAAGASRVDEALRIERSVAESEGTPGPADPRRFARLWSAARLARLLGNPPTDSAGESGRALSESVVRKLKELQIFRGPGTLVILTWEELGVDIELTSSLKGVETVLNERTDAAVVGLSAGMLPGGSGDLQSLFGRLRSVPADHPVKLLRHDITYDGKTFQVKQKAVELPARAGSVPL